jgi:hypothetical protein
LRTGCCRENVGQCAGVPGHIHAHIVPRWNGDINFITILGNARIIPQAIDQAYAQLKDALAKLTPARQLRRPPSSAWSPSCPNTTTAKPSPTKSTIPVRQI